MSSTSTGPIAPGERTPRPKMATDIPSSTVTPDRVDTRLGTLRVFDGLPDDATVETDYAFSWLDTKAGPLVLELPPGVLGLIDDSWQRYVGNVGNAGPDRGEGGTYLLPPPDFVSEVPEGHFVLSPHRYGHPLADRAFFIYNDGQAAGNGVQRHLRIHPLAKTAVPSSTTFIDVAGSDVPGVVANG